MSSSVANQVLEMVVGYGPRLAAAIALLFGGLWLIGMFSVFLKSAMDKSGVNASLKPFLLSLANIALKALLVITVLSMVGIEMTSIIAVLGAAGLAVGLALSGTLQNFAGGVMILIFKPFSVGDVIEAGGHKGKVAEIQIFNTFLKTPDNITIIIPNAGLSNSSMVNFSTETNRRVDWVFGVAYGEDVDKVRRVIRGLCDADKRIFTDPEVLIAVSELASSSVNFTVRAWVNAADYWDVFFDMNENIYKTLNKEGISIPFPQMEVHVKKMA